MVGVFLDGVCTMSQMFETRLRLKDIQNVEISELCINTTITDVDDKNMPEIVWIETMQSIDSDIDDDQYQEVDFDNGTEPQIVYNNSVHNEPVINWNAGANNENDLLASISNLNLNPKEKEKKKDSDNDDDSKELGLPSLAPPALLPIPAIPVLQSKFASEGINKMKETIGSNANIMHDNNSNDNHLGLPISNSQIANRIRSGTRSSSYTEDGHTKNTHLMPFDTGHTSRHDHDTILPAHDLGARKSVSLGHIIPQRRLNRISGSPISEIDAGDEKNDSTLDSDDERGESYKLSIGQTRLANMISTNKELEGVLQKGQDVAEANKSISTD